MHHPVAFRCKNCGHFARAESAGENLRPHACQVCDSGVRHNPTTQDIAAKMQQPGADLAALAGQLKGLRQDHKELDPDNWEVLDECTPERLKELGLERKDVCSHKPDKITKPVMCRTKVVSLADGVGVDSGASQEKKE